MTNQHFYLTPCTNQGSLEAEGARFNTLMTHDCIKDITGTLCKTVVSNHSFLFSFTFCTASKHFWRRGCSTKDVMTSPQCTTFILKEPCEVLVIDSSFSSDKYSEGDLLCCFVSPSVVLKYNAIPEPL